MLDIKPGRIIDEKYRLLESIGEGGTGCVYKATDLIMERQVAVKFLKPSLFRHDIALKRFEREAKILSSFEDPNIIRFFRFGIYESEHPFLVMELCEGRNLAQIIEEHQQLLVDDSLRIAMVICEAMENAHRRKILHRDLKPENILVPPDGDYSKLKIVDFGLAKIIEDSGYGTEQYLTTTGQVLGSFPYMSPEQCKTGKADTRSDIYSLTCLLFEMLCGRPPFVTDTSPADLILQHTNSCPPTLKGARPDLQFSDSLEYIVAKGLNKNPDDRFQTMFEMGEALCQVLEGRADFKQQKVRRNVRRDLRFLAPLILVVALLPCGLLSWRYVHTREQEDFLPKRSKGSGIPFRLSPDGYVKEAEKFFNARLAVGVDPVESCQNTIALCTKALEQNKIGRPNQIDTAAYYYRGLAQLELIRMRVCDSRVLSSVKQNFEDSIRSSTAPDGSVFKASACAYDRLARLKAASGEFKEAAVLLQQAYNAAKNGHNFADHTLCSQLPDSTILNFRQMAIDASFHDGDPQALSNGARFVQQLQHNAQTHELAANYVQQVCWLSSLYQLSNLRAESDRILESCKSWLSSRETIDDSTHMRGYYMQLAVHYNHLEKYTEAIELFKKALSYGGTADSADPAEVVEIYSGLSGASSNLRLYKDARDYAQRACDFIDKHKSIADPKLKRKCQFVYYANAFRNCEVDARAKAKKAFEEWKPDIRDVEVWIDSGLWIAAIYDVEHDVASRDELMKKLQTVLDNEKVLDQNVLADKYKILAERYNEFGACDLSIKSFLKAVQLTDSSPHGFDLRSNCYCMMGMIEDGRGRHELAGGYWLKALQAEKKAQKRKSAAGYGRMFLYEIRSIFSRALAGDISATERMSELYERWGAIVEKSNISNDFVDTGGCLICVYMRSGERQKVDALISKLKQMIDKAPVIAPAQFSRGVLQLTLAAMLLEANRDDAGMEEVASAIDLYQKDSRTQNYYAWLNQLRFIAEKSPPGPKREQILHYLEVVRASARL